MTSLLTEAFFVTIIGGMIPRAIPVLSAAMGEVVAQNSGVLNIGIEGYMLMGAIAAFAVDFTTSNLALAFLVGGATGAVFAVMHAVASVTLRADQIVSGTAIWFIGWGLSGVLYRAEFGSASVAPTIKVIPPVQIPYLTSLPVIGPILFGQDIVAYMIILSFIAIHYFLYHTRFGLNLRTVGENPRVAEIAGVDPIKYRYMATAFCGFMSGIGGAYIVLAVVGSFYYDITAGIGFIAVALVYFGKWTPLRTFIGSLIFGLVYVSYLTLEIYFPNVPYQFFAMWPYLAALIIIVVVGARSVSPGALAQPYSKEG